MENSRLAKYSNLTGAASVLVLIIATGVLGVYDYLPTADRLMEVFSGNTTRAIIVGYLGLFSAVLLMWFAGSVYTALSEQEGESKWISMIAFGGCLASGIAMGVGFSATIALGSRIGAVGGISPGGIVTLYDFYGTILGQMAAVTFAVLIAAIGGISLKTDMYPKWLGWVSLIIALGLISPVGYFVLAFAMIWLVGFSISLFRRAS